MLISFCLVINFALNVKRSDAYNRASSFEIIMISKRSLRGETLQLRSLLESEPYNILMSLPRGLKAAT